MGFGDFLSGAGDALNVVTGGPVRRAIFGGEDPLAPNNLVTEATDIGKGLYEGGKLSVQMSQIPRKVLTEAVLHPTEITEHLGSAARTAQEAFNHRRQIADLGLTVGKKVLEEQLDPKNIALNVALIAATGGASAGVEAGAAGMAGVRAYKEGATAMEAYRTARAAMTVAKGARAGAAVVEGEKAAETAKVATETADVVAAGTKRGGWFSGATRGEATGPTGMLERYGNWRAGIKGDIRQGLGMPRQGVLAQQRQRLAAKVGERIGTEGFAPELIGRSIAGVPGAPTTGGFAAESLNRGRSGLAAYKDVQKAQTYTPLMHAISDPGAAATEFGLRQVKAHKGEIAKFAASHADDIAKIGKKVFGGGEEKGEEKQPHKPYQQAAPEEIPGLQSFQLDNTHATRTSKRQPNQQAALGTVTSDATMPSQIGPSDWYGPQSGYQAGRGYSRSGPLPSLEQPGRPRDEMAGI